MLGVINEVLTMAPEFGENMVATPLGAILDWTMGTPAGAPGEALHGTVLKDTLIAGPYPYRGGDVDVTVRLYAAERDNKARTLLRTAERLTRAIADPGGIATFERTTEAVVSAIESVFGTWLFSIAPSPAWTSENSTLFPASNS